MKNRPSTGEMKYLERTKKVIFNLACVSNTVTKALALGSQEKLFKKARKTCLHPLFEIAVPRESERAKL